VAPGAAKGGVGDLVLRLACGTEVAIEAKWLSDRSGATARKARSQSRNVVRGQAQRYALLWRAREREVPLVVAAMLTNEQAGPVVVAGPLLAGDVAALAAMEQPPTRVMGVAPAPPGGHEATAARAAAAAASVAAAAATAAASAAADGEAAEPTPASSSAATPAATTAASVMAATAGGTDAVAPPMPPSTTAGPPAVVLTTAAAATAPLPRPAPSPSNLPSAIPRPSAAAMAAATAAAAADMEFELPGPTTVCPVCVAMAATAAAAPASALSAAAADAGADAAADGDNNGSNDNGDDDDNDEAGGRPPHPALPGARGLLAPSNPAASHLPPIDRTLLDAALGEPGVVDAAAAAFDALPGAALLRDNWLHRRGWPQGGRGDLVYRLACGTDVVLECGYLNARSGCTARRSRNKCRARLEDQAARSGRAWLAQQPGGGGGGGLGGGGGGGPSAALVLTATLLNEGHARLVVREVLRKGEQEAGEPGEAAGGEGHVEQDDQD